MNREQTNKQNSTQIDNYDAKREIDNEKVLILNGLKEEYNSIQSKKPILLDHTSIIKEYIIK
jgi:hypothetical protein